MPDNYPSGRLCTKDPIAVSRKFSQKFHSFFQTVIVKGEVLGKVTHYFWKKEYQARGAPHYHIVLWIDNAPVIGVDDNSKVVKWIKEQITCRIPDQKTNPELYTMVTKYQMHKCSAYCRHKKKVNGLFVTKCKFGFPRQEMEKGEIFDVEQCLKTRRKIYALPRGDLEVRVNDYNPLIILLTKANMDIQFIAESSLALAHYVTGYVTKAEKSSMQELWQEVSSNKNIYSRLWSFGVRSLRSKECGMYEASDLLLGEHLYKKSDGVKWVDASLLHKRKRRVKSHSYLKQVREKDPDSTDIYEDNLIEDIYPKRPTKMDDV